MLNIDASWSKGTLPIRHSTLATATFTLHIYMYLYLTYYPMKFMAVRAQLGAVGAAEQAKTPAGAVPRPAQRRDRQLHLPCQR